MPTFSSNGVHTRRQFLGYTVGAIGGIITAVIGIPVVGYVISPALAKKSAEDWVALGQLKDFPKGVPTRVEFSAFKKDGWVTEKVQRAVWVYTDDGQTFNVYNPRCTHLGCAVFLDEKDKKLKSPCHGGVFDPKDGKVLGGPPPRSLDTLPQKVEGGSLFAMYKDFKLGVSEKTEV